MCQTIPARVVRIDGDQAWVEGSLASVSLLGVDAIAIGDYILHQAGLALGRVEPEEAEAILAAFRELDALYEQEERRAGQESLGLSQRARP
ncbi:MAG TPA: HypC/HybG/HupF family hydrogenase formation chaperone [Chloroflexota bacterium]|nr:HypC/HybG/HupF family hydrogenase formation chaperone [Chloroflexota bacterium]